MIDKTNATFFAESYATLAVEYEDHAKRVEEDQLHIAKDSRMWAKHYAALAERYKGALEGVR